MSRWPKSVALIALANKKRNSIADELVFGFSLGGYAATDRERFLFSASTNGWGALEPVYAIRAFCILDVDAAQARMRDAVLEV